MASDAEGEEESYHRTDHSQGRQRGDPGISERREKSEGGKSERSVRGIRVRREGVTTRDQSTSEEEVDTQPNTSRSSKKRKRDEDPPQDRNSETVSDIAGAFSLFQAHLKKELKNLKERISEENELSHRRISKKIKLNKESQFKSPGNRKQFTFNENLIHNLDETVRAVKTEKYDRAESVIRKSLADLKKQNIE